ncbi:MAG: NADH-quinone oxidoreductase subunit C [Thermosulfidibacteraceae bacterium]|jgi:NADH-quinone oxidoreductase subunit C
MAEEPIKDREKADSEVPIDFSKFVEVRKIKEKYPEAIVDLKYFRDELTIVLKKEYLLNVCFLLRDDPETKYNFLTEVIGVHYPNREKPFEVVYHLYSVEYARRVRLKVMLGEDEEVESVYPVWPSANWYERECFDMFGIRFTNHPDLRRILLPEDWEGYPLRKDYPLEGPPGYREKWLKEHLSLYNKL